jgi:CMP/dCMP kinase
MIVIAIDGPAGSGKSTVAAALSGALDLETLDTGATYRAMAAAVLSRGIDPNDADAVAQYAEQASIDSLRGDIIDDVDFSSKLRTDEVNHAVSLVAANQRVRSVLVEWQRAWCMLHGGGVIEGRDIGTVVFPRATIKLFLTADPDERARRRADEGRASVQRRDQLDMTRPVSPLRPAEDAWEIDTTDLPVGDIVALVLERLDTKAKG